MNNRSKTSVAATALLCVVANSGTFEANAQPAATFPKFVPGQYMAPRMVASVADPTDEQLLVAARLAAKSEYGMTPLGKIERGQIVHVILPYEQDKRVFNALKSAMEERGVTLTPVSMSEVLGLTPEQFAARAKANLVHGYEGWKEVGIFEPAYIPFLPEKVQKEFGEPLTMFYRANYYPAFFDKHPEIHNVLIDPAGAGVFFSKNAGKKHAGKFRGNWPYVTTTDLMVNPGEFPADVWAMVEEKIAKPARFVSEGTIDDPQGTHVRWRMSREQAARWAQYVNIVNNHLFVYPKTAETTELSGVIAGTANHSGFFPHMAVHLSERGRVVKVEGGGRYGELFRDLINQPKLANTQVPTAPEKGYWYFTADGLGTNPKYVRNMQMLEDGSSDYANLPERQRAGVMHLSFSSWAASIDAPQEEVEKALKTGERIGPYAIDPRDLDYMHKNDLPVRHNVHFHNYFVSVRWKMADTGNWITVTDKGHLAAFDDPEVRALASKYGDPKEVFSYNWVPAIPGINVAGDYMRDYGSKPWEWIVNEWKKIKDGSYAYLVKK